MDVYAVEIISTDHHTVLCSSSSSVQTSAVRVPHAQKKQTLWPFHEGKPQTDAFWTDAKLVFTEVVNKDNQTNYFWPTNAINHSAETFPDCAGLWLTMLVVVAVKEKPLGRSDQIRVYDLPALHYPLINPLETRGYVYVCVCASPPRSCECSTEADCMPTPGLLIGQSRLTGCLLHCRKRGRDERIGETLKMCRRVRSGKA